ncbi:Hypothetical protein PHPALM_17148 [Phytophthora palmivora]|uniref:Uncharacterized protein n=1 Tax=Phytophthora palmivora TaxID=4796 RepID=A0A2P4XMY8_9STRA|nr:Hypothetical protein PHPALM_17148 [Phytophthora palmivora]
MPSLMQIMLGVQKLQLKGATLYCDNQRTIKEVENNGNSKELIHLAKKTRFVAEWVDHGRLRLKYAPTVDNIAVIFTKVWGPRAFERLRVQVNIEDAKKAWTCVDRIDVAAATEDEPMKAG